MSELLEGLDGVECQMDDIIVHGINQEKHYQSIDAFLNRLDSAGVTLNVEKCEFSKEEI